MNINLRLLYSSGDAKEVTARMVDIVAFEQKFDLSISRLGNNPKITHLLFLGWSALKRSEPATPDFDKWLKDIDQVEALPAKK